MVYQGNTEVVQHFLFKGIQLFPGVGVAWVQLLFPIIIERFTFQGKGCPCSLALSKYTYADL